MPAGRPSKFKPEFIPILKNAVHKFKATKAQIAELLQINRNTLVEWEKNYPELTEALKDAGDELDHSVELSLIKRAHGFMRKVQKVTAKGEVITIEEEVPPDATSMIFWLKNRQPAKWRDRQEHELTGKDGAPITPIINITVNGKPAKS